MSSASASQNCIEGNAIYGVHSLNPASAPFANNWWGDASGPRHAAGNLGGTGDWVSDGVLYAPFLASKPASCVD